MSTQLKLRRGTTAQHSTFTGASGEITVDTDKKTVVVHDGATAGGVPLLPKTMTDGTANGVAYLNGSKVLTTGTGLQFDGSNLGLGVTPSAWRSAVKTFQHQGGSFYGNGTGTLGVAQNAYLDSVGWKYTNNGAASFYEQGSGFHVWQTAPSGTAGNAISFTQAMTLDASGNLGVGTTSIGARIVASGTTTALDSSGQIFATVTDSVAADKGGQIMMGGYYTGTTTTAFGGIAAKKENGTSGNFAGYLQFLVSANGTGNVERARIDSSGNLIQSAPASPPALTTNGTMVFNLTSNTNLRVSVRGSDGVTRTANITLA